MFSRYLTTFALLLTFSSYAHAHTGMTPALGVTGAFTRADVQRPSAATECGSSINVAKSIDASTPVVAGADGTFTVNVTNFNPGADGSRSVSLKVDATGIGNKFVPGTVTTNGDATPAKTGSQNIVATLPAGTKCTGGKSKDLCLASFTSTSGFGNCVVVQQSKAAAPPAGSSSNTTSAAGTPTHDCGDTPTATSSAAPTPDCDDDPTPSVTTTATPTPSASPKAASGAKKPCQEKYTNASAAGTRAARAARAEDAAMDR